MNSVPSSPEVTRRRFSVFSIEDDIHVITEQPGFAVEDNTFEGSNYDGMNSFHDDAVSNQLVTPVSEAPVGPRTLRKKKKKQRVIRKRRKKNFIETDPSDVFSDRKREHQLH